MFIHGVFSYRRIFLFLVCSFSVDFCESYDNNKISRS